MEQKFLKLKIHLKTFHCFYLDSQIVEMQESLKNISISSVKHVFLPTTVKKFTVLTSPHVDKKAREQFEYKTHHRILILEMPVKSLNSDFYRILQMISPFVMCLNIRVEYQLNSF